MIRFNKLIKNYLDMLKKLNMMFIILILIFNNIFNEPKH
jgi:hypothetical protein